LPVVRQCARLPRAAVYRKPAPVKQADLDLMQLIDKLHTTMGGFIRRSFATSYAQSTTSSSCVGCIVNTNGLRVNQ
jgi:hypothetical protein